MTTNRHAARVFAPASFMLTLAGVASAQTGPNNRVPDGDPFPRLPNISLYSASVTNGISANDVGDADSFGRHVVYLGVAHTPGLTLKPNCTSAPPPSPGRCVNLNAQPALTTFVENKLDSIELPAKSTQSLLCFSITPSISFMLQNQTGVAQTMAKFGVRPTVVLENPLLNDPALIDPTTGAPFNGRLSFGLPTYFESRNMAVGEREHKNIYLTRHCAEGFNRRVLTETYGLPPTIVDGFFAQPITLTFGADGEAQLVAIAGYSYGVRVYGDAAP